MDGLLLLLLLSHFSHVWLCDPIDGSPPVSPDPGILQARTLEWAAISFSNAWKWKVKGKSLSHLWLLATPWTAAYQAPPSMGFSRQEYWSGVPLPSPFDTYKFSLNKICLTYFTLTGGWNCRGNVFDDWEEYSLLPTCPWLVSSHEFQKCFFFLFSFNEVACTHQYPQSELHGLLATILSQGSKSHETHHCTVASGRHFPDNLPQLLIFILAVAATCDFV